MSDLLDVFVESMLSTRVGETTTRARRPRPRSGRDIAPGDRGVLNAIAPTHFRIADLSAVEPRPPVL